MSENFSYKKSCELLLDMMQNPEEHFSSPSPSKPWRDLLLLDLAHKANKLQPAAAESYRLNGLWHSAPLSIRREGRISAFLDTTDNSKDGLPGPLRDYTQKERVKCDVVIITIIDPEFESCCHVFEAEKRPTSGFRVKGREYRKFSIEQDEGETIEGFVVKCGRPRNVPVANLCRDIETNFETDAMILCGISAGNRDKVSLGSVIGTIEVLDVAGGRLDLKFPRIIGRHVYRLPSVVLGLFQQLKPRWATETPSAETTTIFHDFSMEADGFSFSEAVRQNLEEFAEKYDKAIPTDDELAKIEYHHKDAIASGEQLVADGSVMRYARAFSDKLLGVEMEGTGFAYTCNQLDKPWFIFRGVSDYGDPDKKDNWHYAASISAAVAAKEFLKRGYHAKRDIPF